MVMIIIRIDYITCLVTNDAWNAYDVSVVYEIHHGAGRISYFAESAMLRFADRSWERSGTVTMNGASNTAVGKHGYGRCRANNRRAYPPGQRPRSLVRKYIALIIQ